MIKIYSLNSFDFIILFYFMFFQTYTSWNIRVFRFSIIFLLDQKVMEKIISLQFVCELGRQL